MLNIKKRISSEIFLDLTELDFSFFFSFIKFSINYFHKCEINVNIKVVQWGFLLHKSTGLERDGPNRLVYNCVAVTRPYSHSAYDGNYRYARRALTHDKIRTSCFEFFFFFFFLFFFPFPLSLISPRAFSYEVSFSYPAAIQCLMLWMRLAGTDWPLALRNRASASRVKVPRKREWRNVLRTCCRGKCLCRRDWCVSL